MTDATTPLRQNQPYYGSQPGYGQYPPPPQQPGYPGYPTQQPPYPTSQPGFQQPGFQQPGFQQPGFQQPGFQQPGFQQPGFQQPGFQQPGFQQPSGGYMPPANDSGSGRYMDPEDPDGTAGFEFSEDSVRKAFIRKVYSILMVQLSITLGFICLFVFHEPTSKWVRRHPEIWWIALVVMIVTLIAMACCTNVRRKAPMNFIFLFLFTLAQSFLMGAMAARFQAMEVVLAVAITAAVCLGLTLFAFQTKWDFTVMGGVLFVAVLILLLFGIIAIFIPGRIMTLVYASLGALIFSVYLVYDTQLMMGGKHKYSISPEEYIFAALNLYLDIVNIFMYILTIIGVANN